MLKCSDCQMELDPTTAPGTPCPKCGFTRQTRVFEMGVGEVRVIGTDIQPQITEYSHALLKEAHSLLQAQQPGLAIVVAHIACEVATQRAFARAFAHRGISSDIADAVGELFSSLNLASDRVREFYTALTGDAVKESWRGAFRESAKRRNEIVHKGRRATDAEAVESLTVCDKYVAHITNYKLPSF